MHKRTIGVVLASIIAFCSLSAESRAQDYVGVLPEMLKPEVSEALGLSDEQREQVQDNNALPTRPGEDIKPEDIPF